MTHADWASVNKSYTMAVQTMLTCSTCGSTPCHLPSFCRLCRIADTKAAKVRTAASDKPAERRAASSTIDALCFSLRERGTAALQEGPTQQRLMQVSDVQIVEIGNTLRQLNPEIAPPWTKEQIETLFRLREELR